jgi:LytR cell envelope-related transcriptional attenuator
MAMPPRAQKETASRPMTGRTVGVAVAALLLGGLVLKFGLDKPGKVTTAASNAPVVTAKGATATTTTTAVGGATTTAAPIVATSPPVNSAVDILVANGAEIQGIAGEVGASLQTKGYRVITATNALTTASASTVYFTAGNGPLAKLVATDLGIASAPAAMPPTLPVKEIRTAGILVLLGTDFKKAGIPTANALKNLPGSASAVTAATAATVASPSTAVTAPNTTAKAGAATTTTAKK